MNKEERESKKFAESMMYLLRAPNLFHNDWGDSFPKSVKEDTITQRLIHSKEVLEKEQATDYEAALYLSTMSMTGSLSHSQYQMYMYAMKHGMPDKWEKLIVDDKIDWEHDSKLNESQMVDYQELKGKIFRSQMKRVKK